MARKEKYVLVIGDGPGYYQPFRRFGRFSNDQGLFSTPENISLVVFTGGADISPSLYGHRPCALTFCSPKRDVYELLAYRRAFRNKLPIAGICRGAQFLCAMAGGTLFQHVDGHANGGHTMRTWDGREVHVTSTHHQMQNPPGNAQVLAWSDPRRSNVFLADNGDEVEPPEYEYECVHYPNINAVGMQYHPEMMGEKTVGFRLAEELVDQFLFNNSYLLESNV
jgi:gamma-glutamyl-gamma-aminobutyrate hydrolase PuuD